GRGGGRGGGGVGVEGGVGRGGGRGGVEALVASSNALGLLQLRQQLRIGSAVRLAAGPFAERLAILDSLDDSGRIRVLLDILGRQVVVSTGCDNVMPVV